MHRIFPSHPTEHTKPRISSRSRSSIPNGREQRQLQRLEREEANHAQQQLRVMRQQAFSHFPDPNNNAMKSKGSGTRAVTPLATSTVKFGISNILHSRSPGSTMGRARFDELLAEEESRLKNQRLKDRHDEELKVLIAPKVFKIPDSRTALNDKEMIQRLTTPPSSSSKVQIAIPKEYLKDRGETTEDDLDNEIHNYVVPSEDAVASGGDAAISYSTTNVKVPSIEIKPIKLRPKLRPKTGGHVVETHSGSNAVSGPSNSRPMAPRLNRAAAVERAYRPIGPTLAASAATSTAAAPPPSPPAVPVEPKIPNQTKSGVTLNVQNEMSNTDIGEPACSCSAAAEQCAKCTNMSKKLRKEVETSRNLQRQNGCLEGIITQKRNLVEQLSRQVRVLMKENMQLAKGMQVLNKNVQMDTNIPSDSSSATNISTALQTASTSVKATTAPSDSALQVQGKAKSPTTKTGGPATKRRSKGVLSSRSQPGKSRKSSTPSRTRLPPLTPTPVEPEPERRAESRTRPPTTMEVTSLKNAVDVLQFKLNMSVKENEEVNAFLADLLYTLNARGYETVTDHKGNIVDLCRCRGEHLLDLKGRDARARTPVKKMVQQENLLKAVIGSQERYIQSLIVQIQEMQKEALLGKRLSSSELSSTSGENSAASNKSAAMEQEILLLIKLLESACERNPEVYCALRDEQHDATIANGSGNLIIEAVLDRHERVLNANAQLRQRNREISSSRSDTPPPHRKRSLTAEPKARDGQSQGRDNSYNNQGQGPTIRYSENLSLLNAYGPIQPRSSSRRSAGSYSERLRGTLRPATSSTNFLAFPDNLNLSSNLLRQQQQQPSQRFPIRPATGTTKDGHGNHSNPKRHSSAPSPSKCTFCGERFPQNATLAEINDHINLHLFSDDK